MTGRTISTKLAVIAMLALFFLLVPAQLPAEPVPEPAGLAAIFDGFDAAFCLTDADGKVRTWNGAGCERRGSPCSSFKPVHALIGLECGAVEDERSTFAWDGTERAYPAWNRDLDLGEAIRLSAYWCFQVLAQRIGVERERLWLERIGYGNADASGGLTIFWQQSSLAISPVEQAELWRRIFEGTSPFAPEHVATVKRILRLEEREGSVLYGKTGSGTGHPGFEFLPGDSNRTGWFVGFIEKDGSRRYFALRIEAESGATGQKAKQLALAALARLGAYP